MLTCNSVKKIPKTLTLVLRIVKIFKKWFSLSVTALQKTVKYAIVNLIISAPKD